MSTRRRKTLQPWLTEQRAKEEQARAAWEALAAETRAQHRAQREQVQRNGVMHSAASSAGFLLNALGSLTRIRDAAAGAGSLGLRP
jgi:hypothetical protein